MARILKVVAMNGDNINDGAKYLRMEPPMISVVSLVLAEPTKNDPVVLGLSIINVSFQLTGSIKTNIDTDINVKHQACLSRLNCILLLGIF